MNHILIERIVESYKSRFGKDPDHLIFSPGRINLIGEHVDYNDGKVIPAAIDKGIYIAIGESINAHSEVFSEHYDQHILINLNTIEQSENNWANYIIGTVAQIKKRRKIENFNAVFDGDIPLGAGLSSSAALTCGFSFAIDRLFQLELSRTDLALMGQIAEQTFTGVNCGIMDHFASVHGRRNNFILLDCRKLDKKYLKLDLKEYKIILFDSCVQHELASSAYNERRHSCEKAVAALTKLFPNVKSLRDASHVHLDELEGMIEEEDLKKSRYVVDEMLRVEQAVEAIEKQDWKLIGDLLNQTHEGLRDNYEVSCEELDFIQSSTVAQKGVLGGRMMGGGFGGCTINLIEADHVEKVFETVSKEYMENFGVQLNMYMLELSSGTTVI